MQTNCFKPLGVRNNFVTKRDPQIITNHHITNHQRLQYLSGPSREPEDLVAMGTIWNPNNAQVPKNNNNNIKSLVMSNPTATQISVNSINPAFTMSKKIPTSRISQYANNSGSKKEVEPHYSDPIVGSPPSFQQRLAELAALESETIRLERRKFKKKKQHDSS